MVYDVQTMKAPNAGPLTQEERERWGIMTFCRLEIPLDDPIWFRTVADRLRSLATDLDLLSRTGDRPAHHIAWEAERCIRLTNQAVKRPTRASKTG